jgi:hypothetical protein
LGFRSRFEQRDTGKKRDDIDRAGLDAWMRILVGMRNTRSENNLPLIYRGSRVGKREG